MNPEVLKKMRFTGETALIVNAPEGMVPAGWSSDLEAYAQQSVPFAILFVKNECYPNRCESRYFVACST